MTDKPVYMKWTGDSFVPVNARQQKLCDAAFVIGENYALVEHQDRSIARHRAYFASMNEAFHNLPVDLAEQFLSVDQLRKFCLIKCGFCTQSQHICRSRAEAIQLMAFIKPLDEYAIVTASGPVVTVYRAMSQSMRAMGKDEFNRSMRATLDYAAGLLSVSPRELEQAGRQVA